MRLQRANPGRQEWVTSLECICADRITLPPLIIFKAENVSHDWILADTPEDWSFSYNSKGWTSNQHSLEWLQCCFDSATQVKTENQFRILICDGYNSHISGNFVEHCMNNRIHLMILPPHSSHLTQPLDVGVFGPLKRILASKLEPLLRTGVARIQKPEFASGFIKAHEQAFRESNILGGFCGTGIPIILPKFFDKWRNLYLRAFLLLLFQPVQVILSTKRSWLVLQSILMLSEPQMPF